jgi:hypothetical protein
MRRLCLEGFSIGSAQSAAIITALNRAGKDHSQETLGNSERQDS